MFGIKVEIGVDIIEIARIKKAAESRGKPFLSKIFTPAELAFCGEGAYHRLAARFAAKEAVSKVLGTGIGPVKWTDIEICCDDSGKPEVRLHGNAAGIAQDRGLDRVAVSLSHCREYAIAYAHGYGRHVDEDCDS